MQSYPVRLGRRLLRLHGDAVINARGAVRRDDAARRHRETVAADVAAGRRELVGNSVIRLTGPSHIIKGR